MPFLFGKGRTRRIPANATFRLTEQGKEKLLEFQGDPKSRILESLESRGTSDIEEIASASGVSQGQAERLVPVLIRGGYIQYVGTGTGGADDVA